MSIKLTNETFIAKAKTAHGDLYDYSLVAYQGAHTKIKIICPIHGIWEQQPNNHLLGKGCKVCAYEASAKTQAATAKAEFANKASIVHNSKYDYSQTVYKHSKDKVKIMCPIHGEFLQSPTNHLSGNGCKNCTDEARGKALAAKAALEFAEKANIIHNSKYDYSLVDYQGAHTKVKIICPVHGIFLQTPNDHKQAKGCPLCALQTTGWTRTKFKDRCIKNNDGLGILYILECFNDGERFIKIGITSNSIKRRYDSKASMPYEYTILHELVADPEVIYDLETLLHKKSCNYRYTPSIPFGGSSTECFEADPTYIQKLNTYINKLSHIKIRSK